jgi:Protein of unknown function (DUF2934)
MAGTVKKTTTAKKPSATTSVKVPAAKAPAAPKKKTAAKKSKVVPISLSTEEIARLAHRFWAERGYQHGHDAEDWLRAEAALRGKAS